MTIGRRFDPKTLKSTKVWLRGNSTNVIYICHNVIYFLHYNYSNRELNMWARLTLDILVSVYFISKISPLIINYQFYSNELMRDALVPIILTTVVIAIIYSIIVFGTINTLTKREEKDERDYIYELKSYKISNNIYQISNYLVIGVIIFNALYQENFGELTPQKIAMILLIITLLSSTGKSLTQLFNYRKNI